MTIHFHGSPIWGDEHAPTDMLIKALYRDSGAFVSFARPEQMKKIAMFPCDIRLDNGAFSDWMKALKKGTPVDWSKRRAKFYDFVGKWFSRIEWFLIPDVIEGTEAENDEQIELVPDWLKTKAVPVWHTTNQLNVFYAFLENLNGWRLDAAAHTGTYALNGGNREWMKFLLRFISIVI